MHACKYVIMHVCVLMYVCMHAFMRVCFYVFMSACLPLCICVRRLYQPIKFRLLNRCDKKAYAIRNLKIAKHIFGWLKIILGQGSVYKKKLQGCYTYWVISVLIEGGSR